MQSKLRLETVDELLKHYRIPYRYPKDAPIEEKLDPTWNGRVLTLEWDKKDSRDFRNIEWALHEISHHLFAKPETLELPNYGLGSDPGGGGDCEEVPSASRFNNAQIDEDCVCILDLVLLLRHGFYSEEISSHMLHYNIPTPAMEYIDKLTAAGFDRDELIAMRTEIILLSEDPENDG
jgi:hypothetical protein